MPNTNSTNDRPSGEVKRYDDQSGYAESDEWVEYEPPGLKLKYILSWIGGREKRGMKANPWGFRETVNPPLHATSPHLVPRPFRPLWVIFYYIPLYIKKNYVDADESKGESTDD